ncbi:MAG: hypothetical protein M3010_02105 [Candidatus Dormibacteraeota bacterium]|nr:hypothetical protein [Candidatus Dormibacteraeota bacterium]
MRLAPGRRAAAAHAGTLVLGAVALLYMGRGFWFHYDEWDIVGNHSLGLFEPHSEHWSTLPYLAYRGLYPVFGLRQYLPYLAIVVALHLGVVHLAWRVLRQQGVNGWISVTLAAAFLALGAGAENLVWAWQMGFVGSVFFGYAACLLVTTGTPGRRRDVFGALALLAAMMCSGIGLVMTLVAGVAAALRRGPAAAAAVVLPAVIAFGAWYAAYGHRASGQAYARPSVTGSLQFAWVGLTATAERASGLRWLGPLLVVAALAWAASRLRAAPSREPLAIAGVVGALGLFTLISAGRLQFGVESARQGRYVYVAAALLLPVTGLALQWLAGRRTIGRAAAALLVGWALVHGAGNLVLAESQHRAVSASTRALVLAAAARLDEGQHFDPSARPDPVAAPTLTLARIAGFKREGALPPS